MALQSICMFSESGQPALSQGLGMVCMVWGKMWFHFFLTDVTDTLQKFPTPPFLWQPTFSNRCARDPVSDFLWCWKCQGWHSHPSLAGLFSNLLVACVWAPSCNFTPHVKLPPLQKDLGVGESLLTSSCKWKKVIAKLHSSAACCGCCSSYHWQDRTWWGPEE